MTTQQLSTETYEGRASFLRHVYISRYEGNDDLGECARCLGSSSKWDQLRSRETRVWPVLFHKWGIDGAPLLAAWKEFTEEKS
jgi:hypothetical protein